MEEADLIQLSLEDLDELVARTRYNLDRYLAYRQQRRRPIEPELSPSYAAHLDYLALTVDWNLVDTLYPADLYETGASFHFATPNLDAFEGDPQAPFDAGLVLLDA